MCTILENIYTNPIEDENSLCGSLNAKLEFNAEHIDTCGHGTKQRQHELVNILSFDTLNCNLPHKNL